MDREEFRQRLQEIKDLEKKGRYADAADIIAEMNWKRVKSASTLCNVGTIMGKAGRYEEGKDLLLMAYDRASIGRSIVYELVELALDADDIEGAERYLEEYKQIASKDPKRYVLEYRIAKSKGASAQELVPILEKLTDQEFSEQWAYELALNYHKSGDSEKCIKACDDLVLYFGDGEFVQRALELKSLHSKLTDEESKKLGSADTNQDDSELERAIQEKYAVVSLHKELTIQLAGLQMAESLTEIEAAMVRADRIAQESQLPVQLKSNDDEKLFADLETQDAIDASLNSSFKEILADEGKFAQQSAEEGEEKSDATMSIDEVLAEWEKTKIAAEAALKEAEQKKIALAKKKAVLRLEDLIDQVQQLSDALPELTEDQLAESAAKAAERKAALEASLEAVQVVQDDFKPYIAEPEETKEPELAEGLEAAIIAEASFEPGTVPEISVDDTVIPDIAVEQNEVDQTIVIPEAVEPEVDPLGETQVIPDMSAETMVIPDVTEFEEASAAEEIPAVEEPVVEAETEADQDEEVEEAVEETSDIADEAAPAGATMEIPQIDPSAAAKLAAKQLVDTEGVSKFLASEEAAEEKNEMLEQFSEFEVQLGEEEPITYLTSVQKENFNYFLDVDGMEAQICSVLEGVRSRRKDLSSTRGNIIITGESGSGKTTLATQLIKLLQQEYPHQTTKVGRIYGESLNDKPIRALFKKVSGGYLIIENAADMSDEKIHELSAAMEENTGGLLIVLEDTRKNIAEMMAVDASLARKFSERIRIPIFTSDELVSFGKSYALDKGYVIDEIALLALYQRIGTIARADRATSLEEVKEIMDHAMAKSGKKGLRGLFSSKTDSKDNIILFEKDFD